MGMIINGNEFFEESDGKMQGWIYGSEDLVEFLENKKVTKEKILNILEACQKYPGAKWIEGIDDFWYDEKDIEYLRSINIPDDGIRAKIIEVPIKTWDKGVQSIKF